MPKAQMSLTTVAQKPNQGTNRKTGCYRSELVQESGRLFCRRSRRMAGILFWRSKKEKKVLNDKLPSKFRF
jgi:hypothetical protein